jgi:hypothetical protein
MWPIIRISVMMLIIMKFLALLFVFKMINLQVRQFLGSLAPQKTFPIIVNPWYFPWTSCVWDTVSDALTISIEVALLKNFEVTSCVVSNSSISCCGAIILLQSRWQHSSRREPLQRHKFMATVVKPVTTILMSCLIRTLGTESCGPS